MSDVSQLVAQIIKNRKRLVSPDNIEEYCKILFELALSDRDTAYLLFHTSNRINQAFGRYIDSTKLSRFVHQYPDLKTKLIEYAQLSRAIVERFSAPERLGLGGELDQLEEAYKGALDGRTKIAVEHNRFATLVDGQPFVLYKGKQYPMITRHTRDFNQVLFSAGGSDAREIIQLDPSSEVLQLIYKELRKSISGDLAIVDILQRVSEFTQKVFKDSTDAGVDAFVKRKLKKGDNFIPLDDFIITHVTHLNLQFK